MERLKGKNAIITGSSTGIGRAIAIRFAAEGANVVINYNRSAEEADETRALAKAARMSPGRELIVHADVADEQQVQSLFAQTLKDFGTLDILINNAGIQKECPSHEIAAADFDRILGVNLRGPFLCSREAIRHFLSRNSPGVIVNNSSVHEIIPKPQYLPYSVSKGGLENLTRTLALEYADRKIRVNSVGPGAIITPINRAWIDDPRAKAVVESHIPMSRAGEAEEIAAVFAFLASDEASYITGQTLYACGGLTLFPEFRGTWAS